MGKELTFAQVDQYSKQFGAYLRSRGLEPGDKIALMMPNGLQYPICLIRLSACRSDRGQYKPICIRHVKCYISSMTLV